MRKFLLLSLLGLMILAAAPVSADGGGEKHTFGRRLSRGCEADETAFDMIIEGFDAQETYRYRSTTIIGSLIYEDIDEEVTGKELLDPDSYWLVTDGNSGGTKNANFPLPPNTWVRSIVTFYNAAGDVIDSDTLWFICNTREFTLFNPQPIPAPVPPSDGRINTDQDQAAVVYCRDNGIEVLSPRGVQLLFATQAEIDTPSIPLEGTFLIKNSGDWSLYRLPGGGFQLNGPYGNPAYEYVVIWDACPATAVSVSTYPH